MTALVTVGLAALGAAALTLFSGFGLGTILLPLFALFFPPPLAVAATAVVHGANNLAKVVATGRHADRRLILRFGLPALFAAFAGAALLTLLAGLPEMARYELLGRHARVTPVGLVIAALMLFFALFELLPRLRELRFPRRFEIPGGALSGFFGGLSGHQGALRAAFLTKVGLSTAGFVGTSAAIGLLVDLARLAVYLATPGSEARAELLAPGVWPLVATGVVAAWTGVAIGRRLLGKVTMAAVRTLAGILMLAIALALGAGLL